MRTRSALSKIKKKRGGRKRGGGRRKGGVRVGMIPQNEAWKRYKVKKGVG